MDPTLPPTLGDLLTNAKKVTVSVLYWYEKLSSLLTEIFKLILKRIKNLFCFFLPINPLGGSHRQGLPPRTQPATTASHRPQTMLPKVPVLFRVRPYLVESTTSRPICEVKQLQA